MTKVKHDTGQRNNQLDNNGNQNIVLQNVSNSNINLTLQIKDLELIDKKQNEISKNQNTENQKIVAFIKYYDNQFINK